ncbi:MAG: hypothetical protein ACRDEB_00670 [Chitinophagaceae bacterium]
MVCIYCEAFGFFYKGVAPEHSLDGGIAYFINDNMKVDASVGFGVSPVAPKNYVAIGYSFRFKIKSSK